MTSQGGDTILAAPGYWEYNPLGDAALSECPGADCPGSQFIRCLFSECCVGDKAEANMCDDDTAVRRPLSLLLLPRGMPLLIHRTVLGGVSSCVLMCPSPPPPPGQPTRGCALDSPERCGANRHGLLCGKCVEGHSLWRGECQSCELPPPRCDFIGATDDDCAAVAATAADAAVAEALSLEDGSLFTRAADAVAAACAGQVGCSWSAANASSIAAGDGGGFELGDIFAALGNCSASFSQGTCSALLDGDAEACEAGGAGQGVTCAYSDDSTRARRKGWIALVVLGTAFLVVRTMTKKNSESATFKIISDFLQACPLWDGAAGARSVRPSLCSCADSLLSVDFRWLPWHVLVGCAAVVLHSCAEHRWPGRPLAVRVKARSPKPRVVAQCLNCL